MNELCCICTPTRYNNKMFTRAIIINQLTTFYYLNKGPQYVLHICLNDSSIDMQ